MLFRALRSVLNFKSTTLKRWCFILVFTLNLQGYNTCIYDNLYTIYEQISSFSCFIFIHMRLQHVTITTMKGFFYLPYVRSIGFLHWYRFHQSGFKITLVVLPWLAMQVLVEDAIYVSQGKIPMSTEGMLHISGSIWVRCYLTVWSTRRCITVTAANILCKYIHSKWRR